MRFRAFVHVQNEKRQLQTALVVEQRVKRTPTRLDNNSFTEAPSDPDSDSAADDVDGHTARGDARSDDDDEECFVDCEPTASSSLDALERSSSVTSTRQSSCSGSLVP